LTSPDNEIRSELFQVMLSQSPDAIVFVDPANRIRFWSRSAETLFGIGPAEFPEHVSVRRIVELDFVSHDATTSNSLNSKLLDSNSTDDDLSAHPSGCAVSNSDGNALLVDRFAIKPANGDPPWQMFVLKRVVRPDARHAELERQALTDPLSDLLNRRGFQQALEAHLDRALTLAIIDVDFFKRINDEFGHETGDDAIKWIAQKLQRSFEDSIGIGRLGGDEFGVILDSQNIDEARTRFESFRDNVEEDRSACPLGMTISIGVAVAEKPGVSCRDLLSRADKAMYRSKQEGRNRVTVVGI